MCSQADHPPYDWPGPVAVSPNPAPICEALVTIHAETRRCAVERGLTYWRDHTDRPHWACQAHVGGLQRRNPETLPERSDRPHGRLALSTPWARGAFGPADVITIEERIPEGITLAVSFIRNKGECVIWATRNGVVLFRWADMPRGKDAVAWTREAAEYARDIDLISSPDHDR